PPRSRGRARRRGRTSGTAPSGSSPVVVAASSGCLPPLLRTPHPDSDTLAETFFDNFGRHPGVRSVGPDRSISRLLNVCRRLVPFEACRVHYIIPTLTCLPTHGGRARSFTGTPWEP